LESTFQRMNTRNAPIFLLSELIHCLAAGIGK
jgi:hypothetical protein